MPKKYTSKQLDKIYQIKIDFMSNSIESFDKDLKRIQSDLFDMLVTDFISDLTVKDGVIVLNERNGRILTQLNKLLDEFKQQYSDDLFVGLGEKMLKSLELTSDYYIAMTGRKNIIGNLVDRLESYKSLVGLNKNGNLIQGSFLDNLATGTELKTQLSNYMQRAVTTEMDYKSFTKGLKELVKGSDEVNGAMEKYVGTYAHDAFFQQSQMQENTFGEALGLDRFVYTGEIIKTSRPFCIERHGKIFTREQGESWNSINWAGKIPNVDFFAQVGGYGCRHMIRWVTSEYEIE